MTRLSAKIESPKTWLIDREREEGSEHGGEPARERQHGGAAAEEDERQEQQDRERERLGAAQVGHHAVADLAARDERAAEHDVVGALEAVDERSEHRVLVGVGRRAWRRRTWSSRRG